MEELYRGHKPETEADWQDTDGDKDKIDLAELAKWVEWLVTTYQLYTQIRPCWPLHPGAIQILEALRLGRLMAEDAESFVLITWHQALDGMIEMAGQRMSACRGDKHEPEITQVWHSWIDQVETDGITIKSPRPKKN
jgi:hypothetical protein